MVVVFFTCDTRRMARDSARRIDFTSKHFTIQHEIWLKINLFQKRAGGRKKTRKKNERKKHKDGSRINTLTREQII